jgi:uncharacterized membrane protein
MTSWIAQTIPFADAWSMHDADVGIGWWLVMAAFWGAVIAFLVWLLRGGAAASRPESTPPREPTPREILDRRLAEGALDVEEYERRRRLLEQPGDAARVGAQPTALGADR